MKVSKEAFLKKITALYTLHDETANFFNQYGDRPAANSQAISEMSAFLEESVKTAHHQGGTFIEIAADHIIALSRTFIEPMPTIAPWTNTRAILESCAKAAWLLDPNISVKERVQRSFAIKYTSMEAMRIYYLSEGSDISPIKSRIDQVEQNALTLGFPKVKNKNGIQIGIGQVMPNNTELIKTVLNEELSYRLLSAVLHGQSWAIHKLTFKQISPSQSKPNTYDSGTISMEKSITPENILYLCNKATIAFVKATQNKVQLYGFDIVEFEKIKNKVFDEFGFK